MKYKCKAHISYEVIVEADSIEKAEMCVFEALADDITAGVIRVDLFDNDEDSTAYRFPKLEYVDIEYTRDGKQITHTGRG